jgi:hypothetical protein
MPGNHATVHFHTNEAVNDAGFQLSYSSIQGNFYLKISNKITTLMNWSLSHHSDPQL